VGAPDPVPSRPEVEAALRPLLTARGLPHPRYAVVVPVECGPEGVYLLLEVRAAGISQAGDPCFPGGRIEAGEDPPRTAARELEEELAVKADPHRFLGQLPTVHTPLGSRTNVYVCTLSPEDAAEARRNPAEVSELLRVPLTFFLRDPSAADYPVGGHVIWGMTAGIIRHLCAAWTRAFPPL